MTINVDSIWVILGIAVIFGFGGYLGVYWAVRLIMACRVIGDWIVNRVITLRTWGQRWKS
ncbi:hypothetical protein [Enterobacter roggenkampii]|uniref:hypothetical protein n=1 Tax=Enterobacter roggenkampii TaxID=1812935 RepID=UPI0012B70CE0|nr:hypothetical protein [Enterobacter roggenkampii]